MCRWGSRFPPDNRTAYTANFGHTDAPGSTLSVVDLETQTLVADIEVGSKPEQVTLSGDGGLGIFNLAGDGTVRLFQTADPAGTLSAPVMVSGDPSDVDFIDATTAVVANSADPLNFAVLDVSDPMNPQVRVQAETISGFPYAATRIPDSSDFLLGSVAGEASIHRFDVSTDPPTLRWRYDADGLSFPLGIVVDPVSGVALLPAPGLNRVLVLGLGDGTLLGDAPWQEVSGPTYAAIAG